MKLKKLIKIRFIATALILLSDIVFQSQVEPSREPQIKAVCIFNFTQFVEWPANAFPSPQSPMIIGVLGNDPFGTYLGQTVLNEKINNHPLIIRHYKSVEEIKTCHILFVNISNKDRLEELFKTLKGRNVLTVGESRNFIRQGGMIRLYTDENDKMKFQINVEAAKAADLTISSKLLRLAEIVTAK